jgi:hypothetical protein
LGLPIHTILGFLRDSGADCFTSTATFGEIILEVVTAQSKPKTREAALQFVMKRIHQLGDTDNFADEWTLLQMTWQTTAVEIGMQLGDIKMNWRQWTPGDDDKVTTAVREQFGERQEVNQQHNEQTFHQQWRTQHHSVGAQREVQSTGKVIPSKRCIMPRIDSSHEKLIMLRIHRKIWGKCSVTN